MKTFLKIDYYVQLIVFVIISIIVLISFLVGDGKMIWLFYLGVGISQLISYLIRCFYDYKKSLRFKIYGYLIMPIFPILFLLAALGGVDSIAKILIILPILAVFYSPFLALLYIYDNYKIYKSQK